MKKLRLATVFSGIGAIEHAIERLNIPYEIVFASDNGEIELKQTEEEIKAELDDLKDDIEKKQYIDDLYKDSGRINFVQKSYFANYDISEDKFYQDVRFINGYQFRGQVDLFVGGSPCQSFSMVGKRGGFNDTRGTLFYEFVRLVKEIQPKVFIYENVKGVLSHDGGNTWQVMQNVFSELGYVWSYKVMNAKDYGVPQNRERIFVVGIREGLGHKKFVFPKKEKLTTTMKDYLESNVAEKYYLGKKGIEFVTNNKNLKKSYTQINGDISLCQTKNQQFNWHGDFRFEPFDSIDSDEGKEIAEKYYLSDKLVNYVMKSGTKGFYSKPEIDLDVARPLLSTMMKMHRAGVDNYVTTYGRIRKLTPRECLRLMGFCDSFKIVVSDTQAYKQAGNSIVVDVLMHILINIMHTDVYDYGQEEVSLF